MHLMSYVELRHNIDSWGHSYDKTQLSESNITFKYNSVSIHVQPTLHIDAKQPFVPLTK